MTLMVSRMNTITALTAQEAITIMAARINSTTIPAETVAVG
jgi:hypothetical protein